MKTFALICLAFVAAGMPLAAQAQEPAPTLAEPVRLAEDLRLAELAEGVFVVQHDFPWPSNSLLVFGSKGSCLLLDTPYTPEATQVLLNWIIERNGTLPPAVAVNTHFHIDRLGGNAALRAAGIPIHGSDLTVRLLEERGLGLHMMDILPEPYREAYANVPLLAPDKVFPIAEGKVLDLDGERVEIIFPGGGHTPANLVVWLPARKVLFAACIVKCLGSKGLGYVGDGDVPHWLESLRVLKSRFPEAQWVVPGHGSSGGPELIDFTIHLVETAAQN